MGTFTYYERHYGVRILFFGYFSQTSLLHFVAGDGFLRMEGGRVLRE